MNAKIRKTASGGRLGKALIGAGLVGIPAALIGKYVNGDDMSALDWLLWGGSGAAVGGSAGYAWDDIVSAAKDNKVTAAQLDRMKTALADAENAISNLENSRAYSAAELALKPVITGGATWIGSHIAKQPLKGLLTEYGDLRKELNKKLQNIDINLANKSAKIEAARKRLAAGIPILPENIAKRDKLAAAIDSMQLELDSLNKLNKLKKYKQGGWFKRMFTKPDIQSAGIKFKHKAAHLANIALNAAPFITALITTPWDKVYDVAFGTRKFTWGYDSDTLRLEKARKQAALLQEQLQNAKKGD